MAQIIKRPDIMGNIPEIGDVIAYNPPGYKGLITTKVIRFSKAGLPIVGYNMHPKYNPNPSPKTGFIIAKKAE